MSEPVPPETSTPLSGGDSTFVRLLNVAAGMFRRYGYGGTSTRALAEALGMQKASLYYHMPTKEKLLYELATRSMDHMDAQIYPAVEAAETPIDKITALVDTHVRSMLAEPDWHAATLLEMRSLSKEHWATIHARRNTYEQYVTDILADGQKTGEIRQDVDARHLALLLLGTMNWMFFWYTPEGELSVDDASKMVLQVALGGVATTSRSD